MKKFMLAFTLCVVSSLASAVDTDALEDMLVEYDLVDENYRYTDIDVVEAIFELAGEEFVAEQAEASDDDLLMTDLTFTPYNMTMEFHSQEAFNDSERQLFAYFMGSEQNIQDGCADLYDSELFRANDYVIEAVFFDALDRPLGNFRLDNEVCQ